MNETDSQVSEAAWTITSLPDRGDGALGHYEANLVTRTGETARLAARATEHPGGTSKTHWKYYAAFSDGTRTPTTSCYRQSFEELVKEFADTH